MQAVGTLFGVGQGAVAGGAFGLDISPDGATLGICLNGRAMDETRSAQGIDAFDQCSVVRLEIPPSER